MQTNLSALPSRREIKQQESLISQSLRAIANNMRDTARLMDALALANDGGNDGDMLASADIQRILHVGASKACAILRAHGSGEGRMARITRGRLLQLHRDGQL